MSAVKFLRGTILGTGSAAGVGEVVELDDALASFFVAQGRALFVGSDTVPADPGVITAAAADPRLRKARTR